MAITGSPKKMARDIADGFLILTQSSLRRYTPADLKTILGNIALVARDLRAEQIPLENVMALKARNMKLSRLNQAETLIRSYCRKRRIPV
ncbi:hypothetical protein EDC39_11089 [Geothermobacter ehrlichii]|uniref:Uncharacterized protein n=1 Tax=Geothermobacter ehrlichii TaxID=213224 RepID=A0A5D3WHK6_9BACT|nr:hypothetical protein [Geothermobacter ehrlichii]TYO97549.1 hypothetical protein EDC39_11089 [Geothermobacter ehrlichii]